MLKYLDSRTSSRLRLGLMCAGLAAFAAVIGGSFLLMAGSADGPPFLAFTPTLGSLNGRALTLIAALLVAALVAAGWLSMKIERQTRTDKHYLVGAALVLGLGVCFISSLVFFASWQRLNMSLPAPRTELTVTITSVSQDDEEPDCLTAYYFNNSAGFESWVCTQDQNPMKVGAKVRIVEHKNFFGISVTEFTPVTVSPSAAASARR